MQWDKCNKWLCFGKNHQWVIRFDNWLSWFPINKMSIRSWSLFNILWDNGAWWSLDLDNAIILDGKKRGCLNCFIEVTIFGIGIRKLYNKKVTFDEEGFRKSFRAHEKT